MDPGGGNSRAPELSALLGLPPDSPETVLFRVGVVKLITADYRTSALGREIWTRALMKGRMNM
jgi:hypothetical protein